MTRYAVDAERGVLAGAWATGAGDHGFTVSTLPSSCPTDVVGQVAAGLDRLSGALWRCYTHPASAAGDESESNSEAWRRSREREAFSRVVSAITAPNLPENGMLLRSYSPVIENAHMLGRVLHEVGDAGFTAAIAGEAEAEIFAVVQAELGDLSGRSRQAVALTRTDASPVQVAAADRLLHSDPLGSLAMFTEVDPTSAAVAAAHWLHAAATVAAARSGYAVSQVIEIADDIEALPVTTPMAVLDLMEDGASAPQAVIQLLGEAMTVAEGRLPNLAGLLMRLAELTEDGERFSPDNPEMFDVLLREIRVTPLDPSRPALDLLEDLLSGIYGCALLYRGYQGGENDDEDDGLDGDEAVDVKPGVTELAGVDDVVGLMLRQAGAPESESGGEGFAEDDEFFDGDDDGDWPQVGSEEFLAAVRAEAAEHAARLY